jgi:CMP-N-acetylneuraminic acid synthetase
MNIEDSNSLSVPTYGDLNAFMRHSKITPLYLDKSNDNLNNNSKSVEIDTVKTKKFIKHKSRLFENIGIYLMNKINSFQLDDYEDMKILKKIL